MRHEGGEDRNKHGRKISDKTDVELRGKVTDSEQGRYNQRWQKGRGGDGTAERKSEGGEGLEWFASLAH